MSAVLKVTALRGEHVSLAAAADVFLATPRTANPDTHRAYASTIDRVTALLGRDRPLADVHRHRAHRALGDERAGDLEPQPRRRHLLARLVPDQEALGRPVGPG